MVGLPRDISPGARSRRAFFADLLIAIACATIAILLAAGIGVVGFLALLALLALSAWIGLEAAIGSLLRRRHGRAVQSPPSAQQPAARERRRYQHHP